MLTVTLDATDLLRKDGFDDGDLIDDILDDSGYNSLARRLSDDPEDCLDPCFGGAVLAECVRRHLAPRLIGFEIDYDLSIAHNPVRLARMDELDLATVRDVLAGVSATVTVAEILAIAEGMADGYKAAVRPTRPFMGVTAS